jgi:transposase
MDYQNELKKTRDKRDQLLLKLVSGGHPTKYIAAKCQCSESMVYILKVKYGLQGKVGRPKKVQQ